MAHSGQPMHGPGPRMMQPHPNHGPEAMAPGMHGPPRGDMGPPRGMTPRMDPPRGIDHDQRPMHDLTNRPQNGPPPRVCFTMVT